MPLGRASKLKLATCDARLQQLITAVVAGVDAGECEGVSDVAVTCGYRGEAEQNACVAAGTSKTPWPRSKHNKVPSQAVDVVPYPELWSDPKKQAALRAYVLCKAHDLGIPIHVISWDLPHFQLA